MFLLSVQTSQKPNGTVLKVRQQISVVPVNLSTDLDILVDFQKQKRVLNSINNTCNSNSKLNSMIISRGGLHKKSLSDNFR